MATNMFRNIVSKKANRNCETAQWAKKSFIERKAVNESVRKGRWRWMKMDESG